MSFFSSFFKCCESNAIQSEVRTELHIVRTDKHSPSFAIIDNQKFKDQSPKKRNVSKSPSFININAFNIPAASSSPRNNLNTNANACENKPRVSSNNLFEFDMMNNGNNYNINNVENFTSIKNINFIINQPPPPPKNQIFFFDNVQSKNNLESPSVEEWDVGESGAEEGEETQKSGGTSQRRKKDKLKIDLKYATMGDFDWHNLDKESKESSFTEVYRKEGTKRTSSALNEQDVDIALLNSKENKKEKKEFKGKTKGDYKKYQTLDHKKVKSNSNNNNNDVEEMIKRKLKEMPEHENNNNLSEEEEDGSKTPVFTTPPNKRK